MEQKNFDSWNTMKKGLNVTILKPLNFHDREVWWCAFGVNVGNEQDGVGNRFERPCLIIRKLSPTTALVLPLTTKERVRRFQVSVTFKGVGGFVLLDQVRVVDIRRLHRKIGYIPSDEFSVVKQRLRECI